MDWALVYAEVKGWQGLIGSILGFGALTWGALYNFRLNRRRDDRLRELDAQAVALSLYVEIIHLRGEVAALANALGKWYEHNGMTQRALPSFYARAYPVSEPVVFHELSSKLGMLPALQLLPISKFYVDVSAAKQFLAEILEMPDKRIHYGIEWVLAPAICAVRDIEPVLRSIETSAGLPASTTPDMEKAELAKDIAEDQFETLISHA